MKKLDKFNVNVIKITTTKIVLIKNKNSTIYIRSIHFPFTFKKSSNHTFENLLGLLN